MKNAKRLALIYLTVFISSCDEFPSKYIYTSDLTNKTCSRREISSFNPLKFSDAAIVDQSECDVVYGFKESDVGSVADWIRRNQSKECAAK